MSGEWDFPWGHDTFMYLLRQRNVIGMVVEDSVNGELHATFIYELFKDSLTLNSLTVNSACPDIGLVARMCLDRLVRRLNSQRSLVELTLPASSDGLIDCALTMGFTASVDDVEFRHRPDTRTITWKNTESAMLTPKEQPIKEMLDAHEHLDFIDYADPSSRVTGRKPHFVVELNETGGV